jgi:REP element-mobilizing transposase RayT
MARPHRIEMPDGNFHVWNRGVNKADIVFDDADRQYFFDLLPEVGRRFGWVIIEPVLMTNHFHLVLNTPEPTLSRGMKWLEQKFAEHINHRYDRVGHLFQGRFKHQLVQSGTYLLEVLRYVAGPLQQMTDGRLDASILRQLLVALAMIGIMLSRPRGLWPSPEHGKAPDRLPATPAPGEAGGELPAGVDVTHIPPPRQIPPPATHIVPTE